APVEEPASGRAGSGEGDDELSGGSRRGVLRVRLGRRDERVTEPPEPEALHGDGHGAGREVARAGTGAGAGVKLELIELGPRDQVPLLGGDALPHVLNRPPPAAAPAGAPAAARET